MGFPSKNKRMDLEAKINAKAWKEPAFKEKLLADPKAALKEMGVEVPADFNVNIVEEKRNALTLSLYPTPENIGNMGEEELKRLAGGAGAGCRPGQCSWTNCESTQ